MKRLRGEDKTDSLPVVAFYAHKGGVGKTTSCLTMAVRAHQEGKRVMVLDCDPQQNATAFLSQWQGQQRFAFADDYRAMADHYRVETKPCADRTAEDCLLLQTYELGHRNLFDLLRMTPRHSSIDDLWAALPCIGYEVDERGLLSVVAAHPMLSAYDNDLAFEVQMRNFQPNHMKRLVWLLEFLVKRRQYDLVLLDLSPANSFFNQMALASSSHFVLPLTGDAFSLQSLDTLDLVLTLARRNFGDRLQRPMPQLLCLLYTRYTPGAALVVGFGERGYAVCDDDHKQHLATVHLFAKRADELAPYMVGQPRLVMVADASELHKKLGHAHLTVFDQCAIDRLPTTGKSTLGLMLVAQRDEYDVLWQCLLATLFVDTTK